MKKAFWIIAISAMIVSLVVTSSTLAFAPRMNTNNMSNGCPQEMEEHHGMMHGNNWDEHHEQMYNENWEERMQNNMRKPDEETSSPCH